MSSRTGRTARTPRRRRRHEGERADRLLEEQDPDAEVLVMMQQNWPFECSLAGVTTRRRCSAPIATGRRWRRRRGRGARLERGTAKNDVFLVEGEQLRYGSKTAWTVATR